MNSEYSEEKEEESFTLSSALQYIRENIVGLLLLIFAIIIIVLVEHINYINALTYPVIKPPGLGAISGPVVLPAPNVQFSKNKGRKRGKSR